MLQQQEPTDYVIATGETHSVRECVEVAFAHAGLDHERYVVIDPAFLRPAEVDQLIGDPARARGDLGWEPRTSFRELVEMMVDADLARLSTAARVCRAAAASVYAASTDGPPATAAISATGVSKLFGTVEALTDVTVGIDGLATG